MVQTLLRVLYEQTGRKCDPIAIGGGTYARALSNAVAFGSLFQEDLDQGLAGNTHGRNEFLTLSLLQRNANIYANAIIELAK